MRQELWDHLGIEPTEDVSAIRSAYARRLKVTRPEDDAEGFRRLRLAYEQALAIARNAALVAQATATRAAAAQSAGDQPLAAPPALPADASTAPAPPNAVSAPGAPPTTAPPDTRPRAPPPNTPPRDLELEAAAVAFQALHARLISPQAPAEADLTAHLNCLLTSPVLERIAARQQLELALAGLLASTAPRSDVLLEPCIQRFGWHEDERALRSQPAIRAILTRHREVDFLEQLRLGKSDLAPTYEKLRRQPNPIARSLRAYWTGAARSRELRLLALLRDRYPGAIPTLNAGEVAWWERFARRPQINYTLSRLGIWLLLVTTVPGVIAAIGTGGPLTDEIRFGGLGLAVLVGLLLGQLVIIDWPTLYIYRRWGTQLPAAAQAAWLPALCVLLVLTALIPALWIPPWPLAIVGVICCLWAIYVSGPHPTVLQRNWGAVTTSHIGRLVYLNLGLGAWWLFINEMLPLDLGAELGAALALMAASAFGMTPLARVWFGKISCQHRLRWTLVLVLAAVATGGLFREYGDSTAWQPVLAALVTLIVVLHRVPCMSFTKAESVARAVAFWVCFVVVDSFAAAKHMTRPSDLLQLSGQLLMFLTCINLALALLNDRRKQRAESQ